MSKIHELYGIPHCHSSISTGNSSPKKIFETCSKDKIDFIIITDHNRSLTQEKWDDLQVSLKNYKKLKSKCIFGFEIDSFLGHLNIVNSTFVDGFIHDIDSLYKIRKANPDCIITINHPSKKLLDLKYSDKIDQCVDLIEVGNGTKKYKDYENVYYKLLLIGYHLGVSNGQDNHKLNMNKYNNFTKVLTSKKNKSIIKSFKNKNTYSTNSHSLKLSFQVDNMDIGSTIPFRKKHSVYICIKDSKNKISSVYLISNQGSIYEKSIIDNKKIEEKISVHNDGNLKFIYLKIIYNECKSSITSPIFIET